jgi:GNAT superfamily N-acetyltransferase
MSDRDKGFNIRPARAQDAMQLSSLLTELGYPAPPETIAERLSGLIRANETVLVAARGDDIIGMASVHVTPVLHRPTPVGRVTALVVTQSARGRGVGRALVSAAEQLLRERGCELLEVTSNMRRTDAHAFYERLGYEPTSVRFKKALRVDPQP